MLLNLCKDPALMAILNRAWKTMEDSRSEADHVDEALMVVHDVLTDMGVGPEVLNSHGSTWDGRYMPARIGMWSYRGWFNAEERTDPTMNSYLPEKVFNRLKGGMWVGTAYTYPSAAHAIIALALALSEAAP